MNKKLLRRVRLYLIVIMISMTIGYAWKKVVDFIIFITLSTYLHG